MKKIMLVSNDKLKSLEVREKLKKKLIDNKFELVDSIDQSPEVIIVMGGDGTMLTKIRNFGTYDVTFLGINTGNLGFLPTAYPHELDFIIDKLKNKDYYVSSYPLLKVICKTVKNELIENYAFNEIVIKHLEPRLMEAKIYINDKPFNYFTGDGFIISTPIGATGYAIWAGGVATHSELPVYQLIPICPNDNSINRPLKTPMVVPLDTVINFNIVKAIKREVIVACDGKKVSNDYIAELRIEAAKTTVDILRWGEYNYYELYRQKIIDKKINKNI